ncbi:kinase-like domain-containing protein [Chytriomyces cf. hyalinus JEL632]|nr:kinase-like domain-containing protein [Chytriomyces cf. hyalinus JEL632]
MEAVKHISYVQPTPTMTDHGRSTPPLSPITYPAHVIPLKDPDDPSSIHDETASTTSSRSTSQTRPISIPSSSTRPHSRCSASNSSSHSVGITIGPSSPLVPAPPLSPTLTTSFTNPLYAIPHPHEMSSPSFPLLVSLNSKVDLTSLDDLHDGEEGEEVMALHVGRGGGGAGKAGFMVGDSDSESDEEDDYERREEIERRSRFDGLDGAGDDYPMGEEILGGRLERVDPNDTPFSDAATDIVPSALTISGPPLPHQKYPQPSSNPQQQPLNYPPMRVPKSKIKVVGGSVPREPYQAGAKRRAHSKDLFDYIERKPRMSEGVTRLIFKQIADAIAYLHSRGFVHRDIKDENVIIDDSMKVKVIDFGASRSIPKSRTDYFWDFVGTLTYAPPECIPFSADVALEPHRGPEQDVWSLGVLLFILLETRPPFPPNSTREARTRRPILTTSRTDALKDLLFGMLDPVQETRMTMDAVTAHPWFLTMPTMPMAIPRGPCI